MVVVLLYVNFSSQIINVALNIDKTGFLVYKFGQGPSIN